MAWEDHDHHSFNILGPNPKFFKTIVQDIIQEGRLALPRKFVKEHGDCLTSRAIIKVADGTVWEMELSKGENYGAWLEKGWKEFEEHYSLKHGYLLLFKYEGRSKFLVFIFDVPLLEIEYPRKPNPSPNPEQNPSPSPNLNDFIVKIEDSDSENENLESEGISNKSKGKKISQALEVGDGFSSSNPWFKVVMKSYCKEGKMFTLNIPIAFMRKHMDSKLETLILKIEGDKRRWRAKLTVSWKDSVARLTTGWYVFASDTCLKTDDVCVFELVARNELKVHIFRHLA